MDADAQAEYEREVSAKVSLYQGVGCVGCLSVVLLVFGLLAYTVWRSDTIFASDSERVAAILERAVGAPIPEGFRALQGTDTPELRIAVLCSESYAGKTLDLETPLLITVWSWSGSGNDAVDVRREEVLAWWKGRVLQRVGEVSELTTVREPLNATVGGLPLAGARTTIVTERQRFRVVTTLLPASEQGLVALSFLGTEAAFDEAAMNAFLASVPSR